MDLESITKELKTLASREKLTALELDRARELMTQLKSMGVTNAEIVEITGDRWSESTLKGYTRGVKTEDPEPWKSTAVLFSEMISRNLTLSDIRKVLTITKELENIGSSPRDVVSFMEGLKEKGTDIDQLKQATDITTRLEQVGTTPGEIAGFIKRLEEENIELTAIASILSDWQETGITSADARSALGYKAQLEQAGLDFDTLPIIAAAAGKFGGSGEVLEAVTKYTNMEELYQEAGKRQQRIETQAGEIESRAKELDSLSRKVEKAQKEIASFEKALATYKRLEALGLNENMLTGLLEAAEKYGKTQEVLAAINSYFSLSVLKLTEDELKEQVRQKKTLIKSLDEQYSQLKAPIELCNSLLKQKFGLTALQLTNSTAQKYGDVTEVMKAIEGYGALKEIKKETDQARTALAELEQKIRTLDDTYKRYSARNTVVLEQLEALTVKAIEVGQTVGTVKEQTKKDTVARDILNLLRNPESASYESYLPLALLMVKSIYVWALTNKAKFTYFSSINKELQELAGHFKGQLT